MSEHIIKTGYELRGRGEWGVMGHGVLWATPRLAI